MDQITGRCQGTPSEVLVKWSNGFGNPLPPHLGELHTFPMPNLGAGGLVDLFWPLQSNAIQDDDPATKATFVYLIMFVFKLH